MKKILFFLFLGLMASVEANANAVDITTHSYQKVVKVDKKGKKIIKWDSVKKAVPGDTIKYVNSVKNNTDKTIENVLVKNKINPNLYYVPNSAKSSKAATIKFSVDGGKSFDLPKNLYVVKKGKKVPATYKDYNAIEWNINSIEANKTVNVEFKAKIK